MQYHFALYKHLIRLQPVCIDIQWLYIYPHFLKKRTVLMADFTPILPDINFWNHDGEKINLFCMSSKVQKVSQQWMSFKLFWRTAKKGGRLPGGEDLFSGRISRDIWPGGGLKANKYVQFCTSTALLFSLPHVKVLIKILNWFHLWKGWKILIRKFGATKFCWRETLKKQG